MIHDTKKDERASVFDAIYEANIGSYLGVPVYLKNGKMFGTVCAIDPEPYAFSKEEIETMEKLSSILSVLLENATKSSYNTVDDKLMRLEKLALLGQLSAGLAHELRNPMQSVKGFVQFLFEDQTENRFRDIVLTEIDRMDHLIHDFLLVTQPTAPKRGYYDINEIVFETVELIQTEATLHNVELSISVDCDQFDVHVDRAQIKQVMINILKNAIEAVGENGQVTIDVRTLNDKEVTIEIEDNGAGIPIAILGRLGEPFFSTKEGGTGLGLSISKRIIQEHKGSISFENKKSGTKVTISLLK
ncbi:ATP-binding protein [Halalkalibacter alkalisediminis]|uniref:histidine kinase n=1 Tax=Halalkalibacter alkalisediminis TaxID=935616 RepID=A0ABV6NFC3_9BACI|nr:sensor histidine kinase [Halalkalibacter alkalisediminis]